MSETPSAAPATQQVLQRLESHINPRSAELVQRKTAMRNYIEKRVLTPGASSDRANLEGIFDDLSPRERADILYEKLMSRDATLKEIQRNEKTKERESYKADSAGRVTWTENEGNSPLNQDPIDPYLISEIDALWSDTQTQEVFLERYSEARMDAKNYRLSELGGQWSTTDNAIADVEAQYRTISRELFLGQITRPDKVSSSKGKASQLAKRLIELRERQDHIVSLADVPHIPENTDVASLVMYEELAKYHAQAQEGFVWLPSRTQLLESIKQSLQNGRWPWLEGEAGTGKSELADAAAIQLTGNEPTHIPCTSRTNTTNLTADKDIANAQEGGGSYLTYGPLLQAATGYDNSVATTPSCKTGRIARFDEAGRLPSDSPAYAIIKEARQMKPGGIWHEYGKRVLPGFGAVFTSNPVGPRYPDRHEPDPAMRRELAKIVVDYPPMTASDPELYEFMLATIMDQNLHIAVSSRELSPAYTRTNVQNGETLPDGRKIIATENLIADPTDTRHGVLYRLSYAVRELQNAFNYGNSASLPNSTLRFSMDAQGKVKVDTSGGGEPLTLSTSTITLGELASWMKGFNERTLKDDPHFQTKSLGEYLQHKLHLYLEQTDPDDREKIRALFEHYHLFDSVPIPDAAVTLTPKDIGYLSPRVPRSAILSETEMKQKKPFTEIPVQTQYQDVNCVFEDGKTRAVNPQPMEIHVKDKNVSIKGGASFTIEGVRYKYVGYSEEKIVVDTGEGLHRLIDKKEVEEKGVFIESVAQEVFGSDFIGEDAIRAIEKECQQAGIRVQFTTDNVNLHYSVDQLHDAGAEKGTDRERFLALRPSHVTFTDAEGRYDGPVTISALKRLFKDMNPFGDGTLIYDNSWYEGESFIDQPLQAKYAMPTKKLLPESRNKNWNDQEVLLQPGESRREAVETLWDTIAYFAATKQRLLSDGYDWSKTSTSYGYRVYVGDFDQDGVSVFVNDPTYSDSTLGICPAK